MKCKANICKLECFRNRIMAEVEIRKIICFNTDEMKESEGVIEMIK